METAGVIGCAMSDDHPTSHVRQYEKNDHNTIAGNHGLMASHGASTCKVPQLSAFWLQLLLWGDVVDAGGTTNPEDPRII